MEQNAGKILQEKMKKIPFVKNVEYGEIENNRQSAYIHVDTIDKVLLTILPHAYPAAVEKKIKENKALFPDTYLIVAAPYISQASAELCRKYDTGYIDYSGNYLICYRNIYISETGHPNLFPKEDKAKSIFRFSSSITSRILREMLKDVSITWKLKALSDHIGCSIGMVFRVKSFLCEQRWARMDKEGFRITDAEGLLKAWSNAYEIPSDKIIKAYTLSSIPDFEKRCCDIIKTNEYPGCLTSFSGGARYAPVVRYSKASIWISNKHVNDFIRQAEIKNVDTGANVIIYITDKEEVMIDHRIIGNDIVASPVQTYLDLMQQKGRGEEMAEKILAKEILK